MKHTLYIILAFGLASTSVFAQSAKKDTAMHQSMTIERDFSPIVYDANKIDQLPEITDFKVKKSAARYADWIAKNVKSTDIGQMSAGQVIAEEDPYRKGFVEFSAGNYWNADLKAGVNLNSDFSVDVDAFFTQGDLKLPLDENIYIYKYSGEKRINTKWDSRYFDGNAKLNYHHTLLDGGLFTGHIGGGGRNYNLFSLGEQNTQTLWHVFGDLGYENETFSIKALYHHTAVNVGNYSDDNIKLKTTYGWYDNPDWQARFGLTLGADFGVRNPFVIMPEIEYSKFNGGLSRFYTNLSAGINSMSLYELMTYVPLTIPHQYESEKTIFDLTAGYEDNNNGSFKWGIYAGAKYTLDRMEAVMTNHSSGNMDIDSNLDWALQMKGDVVPSNEFEFKAGLYFDSNINQYFGTKASVSVNTNPRFGNGMVNLDLHITSNPTSKLSLDLSFEGDFKREMKYYYSYVVGYDNTVSTRTVEGGIYEYYELDKINLGDYYDLGFRADYKLYDNFTIFAYGKNLLNCKRQLWVGVPAQGINAHAGLLWKF